MVLEEGVEPTGAVYYLQRADSRKFQNALAVGHYVGHQIASLVRARFIDVGCGAQEYSSACGPLEGLHDQSARPIGIGRTAYYSCPDCPLTDSDVNAPRRFSDFPHLAFAARRAISLRCSAVCLATRARTIMRACPARSAALFPFHRRRPASLTVISSFFGSKTA